MGEEGGQQWVQLRLHGDIPARVGAGKQNQAAVCMLRKHISIMVASLLLWLFRTEGVLEYKKWGRLKKVRPS
jgi:hypothetical protein